MRKTQIEEVTNLFDQMEIAAQGRQASLPTFIKPYHLACIAVQARAQGDNISLPPNSDIESYAARMGLWEAIGQIPPVHVNRRATCGRFVEARAVTQDETVHRVSIDISRMFENTGTDTDTCESLQILASELLGNCCAHSSDDDIFGMVTGQVWSGGNLAQLCIVDCGNGIRQSLNGNNDLAARLAAENACQIATEYGVTGKPFGSHSGYGLTLTNDLISQNNGNLIVISGQECYVNREGNSFACEIERPWNGTLIIFEWNTNIPLDINSVYNAWPMSESLEGEDQDDDLFD